MENITTMTSEQPSQDGLTSTIIAQAGLGNRLRAKRESLRLSEKDAAARLRLNPKMIPLMENEDFDNGLLPPTFLRGYLKSYMRMLNIPEAEINATVTQIHATLPQAQTPNTATIINTRPAHHDYRYLRWMTVVVAAALIVLVSMWWNSHPSDTATLVKAFTPTIKSSAPTSTLPDTTESTHSPAAPSNTITIPMAAVPAPGSTPATTMPSNTTTGANTNTPNPTKSPSTPATHTNDPASETTDAASPANTETTANASDQVEETQAGDTSATSESNANAADKPDTTGSVQQNKSVTSADTTQNTETGGFDGTPANSDDIAAANEKPKHASKHSEEINTNNVYSDY